MFCDEPTPEVDQGRLDAIAIEADADAIGAGRLQAKHRSRLAALTFVALTDDGDQAEIQKFGDDLAYGGVGEAGCTGKICLRSLAEAAQALQHQAVMIVANAGRSQCLARLWLE